MLAVALTVKRSLPKRAEAVGIDTICFFILAYYAFRYAVLWLKLC